MKSLKSAARRGGIISAAALSALALASCSAGQITQTADQVAAVDGASASSENGEVAVQDVTIVLDAESGDAALKFTVTNQDVAQKEHTLESVKVDGADVNLGSTEPIKYNCRLVADSKDGIDAMPQSEGCIQYVETTLDNDDFAYAGNRPVVFTFGDLDDIEVDATVSAPTGEHEDSNRPEAEQSKK
ncbi:hypothetical protein QP027_09585 [Corynebacterium breve]|uniref:Lipoprotein LpqE n=1 Tax=Corynebacterium breve TaxID=3049799 RepID=A0ABY8VF12_9CORY|nr:hypothetical protein [Corynebacterium breve]WIM67345.1 hypothetical protein QP027_09585 [Corynebacterium breve]